MAFPSVVSHVLPIRWRRCLSVLRITVTFGIGRYAFSNRLVVAAWILFEFAVGLQLLLHRFLHADCSHHQFEMLGNFRLVPVWKAGNDDTETGIHDTIEFKKLEVRRSKDEQSVSHVCKDLGLGDQTVRNWVKATAEGKLNGEGGRVVTQEEMEL